MDEPKMPGYGVENVPDSFPMQKPRSGGGSFDYAIPSPNAGVANNWDRRNVDEDKMLIEQDPFLLEEQRYLDRMKRAHQWQEQQFKKQNDDYMMRRKRKDDEDAYENHMI